MTTRIQFTQEGYIKYGPQKVLKNDICDVATDSVASWLIGIGWAIDATGQTVTRPPLTDGNELEDEDYGVNQSTGLPNPGD